MTTELTAKQVHDIAQLLIYHKEHNRFDLFKNNILYLMRITESDMDIQLQFLRVQEEIQRIYPLKCLQVLKQRSYEPNECLHKFTL